MNLIEASGLLIPGEIFEMNWPDLDKIINPFKYRSPHPVVKKPVRVKCQVLRVYLRSPYEVRYVCISSKAEYCNRNIEFVLAQIVEPVYSVTVSHSELKVSVAIIIEAAARAGIRSISAEMPNLYTKEDAEKLAQVIKSIPVKERHGYLVPSFVE